MPTDKRSSGRPKTRDRILDVAFELFVQRGFEGTTISEIERKVGLAVGTGSLHYHFRSKQELLLLAVEREIARCMSELEAERATTDWPESPHDQMVLAARLTLGNIRRFDRLFSLLRSEGDRVPGLRQAVTDSLYGSRAMGSWTHEPSRLVAIAALVGYHDFSQLYEGPFQGVSEDDFLDALVGLLPAGRPPGVDEETYSTIRRTPGED